MSPQELVLSEYFDLSYSSPEEYFVYFEAKYEFYPLPSGAKKLK